MRTACLAGVVDIGITVWSNKALALKTLAFADYAAAAADDLHVLAIVIVSIITYSRTGIASCMSGVDSGSLQSR